MTLCGIPTCSAKERTSPKSQNLACGVHNVVVHMSYLFLAFEVPSFLGLGFTNYFTFTLAFSSSGLQYVFQSFFLWNHVITMYFTFTFSCHTFYFPGDSWFFLFFTGYVFPDNLEGTPPFCGILRVIFVIFVHFVYNTETVQGLSPKEEMLASFQEGNQQQRTFRHSQV